MNQMYQNTKKEKREAGDCKVLYHSAHTDMKSELLRIQANVEASISRFQSIVDALTASLKNNNDQLMELKKLDLVEFSSQHDRMKTNFNKFVATTNENVVETTNVFLDMAKRVNEIEARLAL